MNSASLPLPWLSTRSSPVFGELGLSSCVARRDLDPDRVASTVALLAILSSFALAAGMALAADPLAGLLGAPEAAAPIRVLAIAVVLGGVFTVPGALLVREFRQGKVFLASAVAFVPANLVLVLMAVNGDGAMAFAWSRVVSQLVSGDGYGAERGPDVLAAAAPCGSGAGAALRPAAGGCKPAGLQPAQRRLRDYRRLPGTGGTWHLHPGFHRGFLVHLGDELHDQFSSDAGVLRPGLRIRWNCAVSCPGPPAWWPSSRSRSRP